MQVISALHKVSFIVYDEEGNEFNIDDACEAPYRAFTGCDDEIIEVNLEDFIEMPEWAYYSFPTAPLQEFQKPYYYRGDGYLEIIILKHNQFSGKWFVFAESVIQKVLEMFPERDIKSCLSIIRHGMTMLYDKVVDVKSMITSNPIECVIDTLHTIPQSIYKLVIGDADDNELYYFNPFLNLILVFNSQGVYTRCFEVNQYAVIMLHAFLRDYEFFDTSVQQSQYICSFEKDVVVNFGSFPSIVKFLHKNLYDRILDECRHLQSQKKLLNGSYLITNEWLNLHCNIQNQLDCVYVCVEKIALAPFIKNVVQWRTPIPFMTQAVQLNIDIVGSAAELQKLVDDTIARTRQEEKRKAKGKKFGNSSLRDGIRQLKSS